MKTPTFIIFDLTDFMGIRFYPLNDSLETEIIESLWWLTTQQTDHSLISFLNCDTSLNRREAELTKFQGHNQSINQSNFYSANIPSEARLSGATAKSVFNSKIKETVP